MKNVPVTPDGIRYLSMSERKTAAPFHLRWLLPKLLGKNIAAWTVVSRSSILGIAVLTAIYSGSVWMACVAALSGIFLAWKIPVLVDPAAMFLSLAAAVTLPHNKWAALILALIAGCVRESAPVWASIYAWNPVLLVGMVPVAVRHFIKPGEDVLDEKNAWILKHPFKASQEAHAGQWRNPFLMVLPWGGLLLGLNHLSTQVLVALVVAYAQLLVATDSIRLYQWAAPVLAASCATLDPKYLPWVALTVVFNPFKGDGL